MPARDVGRIDPRVAAVVPHQPQPRLARLDDVEPALGAGVGHVIDQQAPGGRPREVAHGAAPGLGQAQVGDRPGGDGDDMQRAPFVLVAWIAATQFTHHGLIAEIRRDRHLADVPPIDRVERDAPAIRRPHIRRPVGAPHAGTDLAVGAGIGAQRDRRDARHAESGEPRRAGRRAWLARHRPQVAVTQERDRRAVGRQRDVAGAGKRAQVADAVTRGIDVDFDELPAADQRQEVARRGPLHLGGERPGPRRRHGGQRRRGRSRRQHARPGGVEVAEPPQPGAVGVHDPQVAARPALIVPEEGQPAAVRRPDRRRGRRACQARQRGHAFECEPRRRGLGEPGGCDSQPGGERDPEKTRTHAPSTIEPRPS